MNKPAANRRQAGLSMVEALIVLAVTCVALGTSLPSFEQARERRQIEAVVAQLETDLLHARSLAVARGVGVRIGFETSERASCYVVHTGPAGACRCNDDGTATCGVGAAALQTTRLQRAPLRISSNSTSMLFEPARGTVTPTATLRVQGHSGTAIHQVVNLMGRVRSCSPGGTLPGLPVC